MTTLYDLLGVSRETSTSDIHVAYRRAAAQGAHPDAGGNADTFARLKLAHDVLTDPERRRRYDETGHFEPNAADNKQAEMLTLLSGAFDDACNAVLQSKDDLQMVDLVQRMQAAIGTRIKEIRGHIVEVDKSAALFAPLRGRFSSTVTNEPNLLDAIVHQKLAAAQDYRRRAEMDIARLEKAALFLVRYRYRSDPRPAAVSWRLAPATGPSQEFYDQLLNFQRQRVDNSDTRP